MVIRGPNMLRRSPLIGNHVAEFSKHTLDSRRSPHSMTLAPENETDWISQLTCRLYIW